MYAFMYYYLTFYIRTYVNFTCKCLSLAFRQRATGPSSVCAGSDVTLQCVVVFTNTDNTVTVQSSAWTIAPDGILLLEHSLIL